MIIKFPDNSHAGRINANTQTVDIPPTILDYLRVGKPNWMDSESLISGQLDEDLHVFIIKTASAIEGLHGRWRVKDYTPPFYSLGKLVIAQCQLLFSLDVVSGKINQTTILDHSAPCDRDGLMTDKQAKKD